MSNKEAKDRRRQDVFSMTLSGVSTGTIAKQLGVTPRTIQKDLEYVRTKLSTQDEVINYHKRMVDYSEKAKRRIQRLWAIMSDSASPKSLQIKAIDQLREEDELAIKNDQKLGLLPKESMVIGGTGANGESSINPVQINIIQQQAIQEKPAEIPAIPEAKQIEEKKDDSTPDQHTSG